MRHIFTDVAAMMLCAAACISCKEAESLKDKLRKETVPEPVCVSVMEVTGTDDVCLRNYVGRVEPSQNVVLTTQFPGKVEAVNIKKGRQAKAGDVIAVLKSESVESAYAMALATLEQARDGYDRMMQVYPKGGVTEVQKMEITTQLKKAEASYEAAKDALEKCNVKAPYSGVVDEVFVEEGVELGLSAPIARILNVSDVEIHFPVPENEIKGISAGGMAEVEVPAAAVTVDARVVIRGVNASALSHSYDCVLVPETACPDILPGMVCKVRLRSDNGRRIIIPMRSVMTDSQGRYVWCAASDGTIQKKYVVTEGFAESGVIISGGLEEGDRLVVDGHRKVSTGMKVKVKEL
ncbi:MAG: efflux RND transporter periplasmic adaptor subunit [Candidatus Cryptobacteroides sp.]